MPSHFSSALFRQRASQTAMITLLVMCILSDSSPAFAAASTTHEALTSLRSHFIALIDHLSTFLFWDILSIPRSLGLQSYLPEDAPFPIVVFWMIFGGFYFTFRLRFINLRLFRHALAIARGHYAQPDAPGEVTQRQALFAAVSGTVGLGNIAGVAVAISFGGPGAVPWMMLAGFLGMSVKLAEVSMSLSYREVDANGSISGGAFHYLSKGLARRNLPRLGKFLACLFAFFCIGGAIGGGNMFQSNQASAMITNSIGFSPDSGWKLLVAALIAGSVAVVLIGGIRRIAHVAEAIVPLMAVVYLLGGVAVLIANAPAVPEAFAFMFHQAFTPESMGGGLMGALTMGLRRAAFSCEAGMGSAPIVHAAAKTREPVREGTIALLEPFLDTIVICCMTGVLITVTGVWKSGSADGALLTAQAFGTVFDWFPYILSVCIFLFAYSTMITWSYYGLKAWEYLFGHGRKREIVFYLFFCACTFFGAALPGDDFKLVVDFSDLLILSMAIPNLLGLFLLRKELFAMVDSYVHRLKAGEFQP